jgi:hypothetical protein
VFERRTCAAQPPSGVLEHADRERCLPAPPTPTRSRSPTPTPKTRSRSRRRTLPKWLKLVDHGDRSATLSGVPAASDAGANTVVLEADDDEDKVQQQFTITVANRAPTAAADSYSTTEGVQLTVAAASGVLAKRHRSGRQRAHGGRPW